MSDLNPDQFLFHGTTKDIPGGRILPAKVHGGHSYWENTGSTRGEASENHAWAHPSETVAWDAAMDRVNSHGLIGDRVLPRGRVLAVNPHPEQSAGHDPSMVGEIKAPHFDIAQEIHIQPGKQGTFPGINWNEHVRSDRYLPGDEDANHPSHLSVQFGHNAGVHGSYSDHEDADRTLTHLHSEAVKEDLEQNHAKTLSRMPGKFTRIEREATWDTPLPPPPKGARR